MDLRVLPTVQLTTFEINSYIYNFSTLAWIYLLTSNKQVYVIGGVCLFSNITQNNCEQILMKFSEYISTMA